MFQVHGAALWDVFKDEGVIVPDDLKLILNATKLDNLYALATFDDSDMKQLLTFMTDTLHLIIPEEDREKYYGLFKSVPQKYTLLGHDKTLSAMTTLAKKLSGKIIKTAQPKAKADPNLHDDPSSHAKK